MKAIEEVNELVNTAPIKRSKKDKLLTLLFMLINVIIVAFVIISQIKENKTLEPHEIVKFDFNFKYLFIGIGIFILFYIFEALSYAIIYKKVTGKFRLRLSMRVAIFGKYWDSITPFGSGGQFAQIAYSKQGNITGHKSTCVVVGKYMIWQIAFCVLGALAIFLPNQYVENNVNTLYRVLAIIGLIINIGLTVFMYAVAISSKLCKKIVSFFLKILTKLRIVKDYDKIKEKVDEFIINTQMSIMAFRKDPITFIFTLLSCFASIALRESLAFIVYKMFVPDGNIPFFGLFFMSQFCMFASSFIPLPGGSGLAELSFASILNNLFPVTVANYAMLIWRFYTFYGFILIGFILTIIDGIRKLKSDKSS